MLGVEVVFARPEISDSGSDVPWLIDRKAIPTGGPSRAKHTTSDQKNGQGQKYAPIIQPIHQPGIIPPGALRGTGRSRRSTVRGCRRNTLKVSLRHPDLNNHMLIPGWSLALIGNASAK